jgi:hypothetical protein
MLFKQSGFHVNELVLQFRVTVSTHILSNYQLLDLIKVSLKVLQTDFGELRENLEILLSILEDRA